MINDFKIPQRKEIVELDRLFQHDLHKDYYGENDFIPETLLSSIKDFGIIDLPIVNPDFRVLIGWRRIMALKEMGKTSTEVYVLEPPENNMNFDNKTIIVNYRELLKDSEEQIIVDSNQYRIKTWLSKAKEIQFLHKLLENKPGRPRKRIQLSIQDEVGMNGIQTSHTSIENDHSEEPDDKKKKGRKRVILSDKFGINEKYIDFLIHAPLEDTRMIELLKNIDEGIMTFASAKAYWRRINEEINNDENDEFTNLVRIEVNENFQLYNQSCVDMSMIPDNSVDLIVVSPPYADLKVYSQSEEDLANKYVNEAEMYADYDKIFEHLKRVSKENTSFYLNVGDKHKDGILVEFPNKLKEIAKKYFTLVNTIIFNSKNRKSTNALRYNSPSFEYIYHFVRNVEEYTFVPFEIGDGIPKVYNRPMDPNTNIEGRQSDFLFSGYRNLCDTWDGDNIVKAIGATQKLFKKYKVPFKKRHPAEYPAIIPLLAILQGSYEGQTVLDCFSGSGKAGEIALNLFRKYIGVELDPSFYEASRETLHRVVTERNAKFHR